MITIGLTGGIGTGKTTVSKILADLGAYIMDADKVGHEMLLPQTEVWHDIIATWGRDLLTEDDQIDRRKLGAIVFSDPAALQKLNSISHPRMKKVMADRLATLRQEGQVPVVIVEAAILIEAKWYDIVDRVWMTHAAEGVAVRRLQARNGMSEEEALKRIRSQLTADERAKYAQLIIDTDCTLDELHQKTEQVWRAVQSDPASVPSRI
ncbi:MAG TPA: dephospho-CoA kinase [Dehalococcoidia bacterium]|nr:dephospho-CoA kinase [Dehalococcoidia bacterium]